MRLPVGKQALSVARGRSRIITITLEDEAHGAYYLKSGETLHFGVKQHPDDKACVIQKTLNVGSYDADVGAYLLKLLPRDTAGLNVGTYYYDVGLLSGADYWPVVECSVFEVNYSITERGG